MPDLQVTLLGAGDFESLLLPDADKEELKAARQADLLVVEDLQHLPARVEEAFVHLMDRGLARAAACLHGSGGAGPVGSSAGGA